MLKRIRCEQLQVVGYSLATVVDMFCDITLTAARLLDEFLADLACELLRGIKDWVQGFWGYIMAVFESVLWQMKKLKAIVKCCYM